jgi:hypothetical protein
MQKEDWKNVGYYQSYVKKTDFGPPFWIEPPFLLLIHVAGENTNALQKQNAKILENA